MRFFNQRLLGLLAFSLIIGCQQLPPPSGSPFGIDVVDGLGAKADALPPELSRGQAVPAGSFVANQLLVQLSENADVSRIVEGFAKLGEVRFNQRFVAIQAPEGMSLAEAHQILASRPGVAGIELNRIHRASEARPDPTDSHFDAQWSHRQTEARALWLSDTPAVDASKVLVAILDTGLDVDHPEFQDDLGQSRVFAPQNFITNENPSADLPVEKDVKDLSAHGTHVAGIIGARGNNGQGVAGVSWNVGLMPVKVLGANGGSDFQILQGLAYALGQDVDGAGSRQSYLATEGVDDRRVGVISMSLGYPYHGRHPAYDAAFATARTMGVVVVVAAGNEGSEVAAPANSAHAIAVSSTSHYRIGNQIWEWLSGFSNRGARIDLAAPGGQIISTFPSYATFGYDNQPQPVGYATISGTSMACPYVSGTAALLVAKHRPPDGATASQLAAYHDAVKQHLQATADDLGAPGKDPLYGWGRINVRKALTTNFPASYP